MSDSLTNSGSLYPIQKTSIIFYGHQFNHEDFLAKGSRIFSTI